MAVTIENSWHSDGGLWQDPDLKQVSDGDLLYKPTPIRAAELNPDMVWTLRGPRRVGKTVALKLLVAELIEKNNVSPNSILWSSADTIRKPAQLLSHFENDLLVAQPKFLFIDEITSVVGWQNVVKKLRDQGRLSQTCLVLTGSSAFDLKAGSERLAGRKGSFQSTDRVLLPMTFRDFRAQNSGFTIEHYMSCGGFPFRVNQLKKDILKNAHFLPNFGMSIFDDVYFYEFIRRRLDRNLALEILFRLSQIQTGAVSYGALAKSVNAKPDTVKKYLDALGDAFLLATIYSYDSGKSRVALKKDKKFVWVDPALGQLANSLGQGDAPSIGTVAEHLVGVQLLRNQELRLFEGLSAPRNVFTWKSTGGNEIDFLSVNRTKKSLMPIEVKYQAGISDWDFQIMERAFGRGILVSRDTAKQRIKSHATPLEDFLLSDNSPEFAVKSEPQ
jgi:predicted AAA+ superfamily ATPase